MTITAIVFVIFLFAVAAITFFVMKKAVKMAIRAAIVTVKYDISEQFVRFDAESVSKLCIITKLGETIKHF